MTKPSAQFDQATLAKLSARDLKVLIWRQKWLNTARPKQLPPDMTDHGGGLDPDWTEWGVMSGRGFGKTRLGAEWICYEAIHDAEALPSAVVAPTLNDVRYTCFEGPSGILSFLPPEVVKDYNKTNLIITLDTGAIIRGFSAEEPERMRGPNFARAWCDELSAWIADEAMWDMLMFTLRLGKHPRVLWTTTPKPKDLVRKLIKPKEHRHITTGASDDNRANLANNFFEQLEQYEGTQLGRQERYGELIDAEEGGIINRKQLRLWPHDKPLPAFEWVLTSLDTAFTSATVDRKTLNADPTACGVFGVFWGEDDTTNVILLDAWQDHLGLPELTKRVKKEMQASYGDDLDRPIMKPLIGPSRMAHSGRKSDIILIEEKGSGISLRQNLAADGIFTYAYNPGRADKLTRLHLASDVFARGQFWVPESEHPSRKGRPKSWAEPLIAQLCSYRGHGSLKHDDFCDVVSQALIFMKTKNLLNTQKRSKQERDRERDIEDGERHKPRVNPYAQ